MTFVVLAEDQGSPIRCDYANVTINVIEINDNRPRFEKNFYSLEIRSDLLEGTPILTVTATDNDTGGGLTTNNLDNTTVTIPKTKTII